MATERQPRRSSAEIRARLVEAARELFSARGFDATTTRDICDRAGVAQQQLFHNFRSKEGIFDAVYVPQLADLVNRYIAAWNTTAKDSTLEDRIRVLIDGLFQLASSNRTVLLSAISRVALKSDTDAAPSDLLDHIARTLRDMEIIEDYPSGIDVPAAIITTAGMVFGTVLLDDMLYPAGAPRLSQHRLTTEMVSSIVHGSLHRPNDMDPPDPERAWRPEPS